MSTPTCGRHSATPPGNTPVVLDSQLTVKPPGGWTLTDRGTGKVYRIYGKSFLDSTGRGPGDLKITSTAPRASTSASKVIESLNNGVVSKDLRAVFKNQGSTWAATPSVATTSVGWDVTDPADGRVFQIINENGLLRVYDKISTGSNVTAGGDVSVTAEDRRFLFTVLDDGTVLDDLQSVFQTNGITLTNDLNVVKLQDGSGWLVHDQTAGRTYLILKDGTQLDVYATSQITADAGGVAVALQLGDGSGVRGAVGIAASQNRIENTMKAYVAESTVNARSVAVDASSVATIDSLSIGGALDVDIGKGSGLDGSGAGAGSGNFIHNRVEASIKDPVPDNTLGTVVTTTTGDVSVTATDLSTIVADAGGLAIGLKIGDGTGLNLSVGISVAVNDIGDTHPGLHRPRAGHRTGGHGERGLRGND